MTQATDLIAKLKTDVLKLVPTSVTEHSTINVIAGILDVASEEIAPLLESKIDVELLLTGLTNVENGIVQTVEGGKQIDTAMKGPKAANTTEGNA